MVLKLTIQTRQLKEMRKIVLVPLQVVSSGSSSDHGVYFFPEVSYRSKFRGSFRDFFYFESKDFSLIFCSELPHGLPRCCLCPFLFCLPTFLQNKIKKSLISQQNVLS